MEAHTLGWLLDKTLPLNRKEQFYTGTVLPALVGADDFAHLDLLGDLVGAPGLDIRIQRDDCTVIFFTEYGIAESAVGEAKERFKGLPTGRDTPDVVILVTEPSPVLIAIEAKMYWRPGGTALLKQLEAQGDLLKPLCQRLERWLEVPVVVLKHVLLLPEAQAVTHVGFPYQIITWEQIRDRFAGVAPHYWLAMLDEALERYPELVGKPIDHSDASITGSVIREHYLEQGFPFQAMGRKDGLSGALLKSDIADGTWREMSYQVALEQPFANKNWFSIADFIERLRMAGQLGEDALAECTIAVESASRVMLSVAGDGSDAAGLLDDASGGRLDGADPAHLRRIGRLFALAAEAARAAGNEASDLLDKG